MILPFGLVLGFLALIVLCTRVRRHGAYTLQDLLEAPLRTGRARDRHGPRCWPTS